MRFEAGAQPRSPAALGLVSGLGQTPFSLWPLTLLGLVGGVPAFGPALMAGRRAFGTGWAFGTGYFALTLHWIVEPFLVDIARHGWMAPFRPRPLRHRFRAVLGRRRGARAAGRGDALRPRAGLDRRHDRRGARPQLHPHGLSLGAAGICLDRNARACCRCPWSARYGLTLLTLALPALTGAAILRRTLPFGRPARRARARGADVPRDTARRRRPGRRHGRRTRSDDPAGPAKRLAARQVGSRKGQRLLPSPTGVQRRYRRAPSRPDRLARNRHPLGP